MGANATVIATGGAGKVLPTNPDTSTGDGIAMAWRAGCAVANMEFIQFHPTCLYHPQAKSFLISEAVRGEGGILRLPDGTRFMPQHDPRAELAPRDVVARAIDFEMKKYGLDCVFLDIAHKGRVLHPRALPQYSCPLPGTRHRHYPRSIPGRPGRSLYLRRHRHGPARTDWHPRPLCCWRGAACTGLHGANRLASNSLAGVPGVRRGGCRRHRRTSRTIRCPILPLG